MQSSSTKLQKQINIKNSIYLNNIIKQNCKNKQTQPELNKFIYWLKKKSFIEQLKQVFNNFFYILPPGDSNSPGGNIQKKLLNTYFNCSINDFFFNQQINLLSSGQVYLFLQFYFIILFKQMEFFILIYFCSFVLDDYISRQFKYKTFCSHQVIFQKYLIKNKVQDLNVLLQMYYFKCTTSKIKVQLHVQSNQQKNTGIQSSCSSNGSRSCFEGGPNPTQSEYPVMLKRRHPIKILKKKAGLSIIKKICVKQIFYKKHLKTLVKSFSFILI
eukprot:TRINITY_DN689_c0_g2_i1.p3 TRINITY_DN689_c0_g2~~TRINITY_DN689_c0_g2_i1.p3  ORF type:complete len:271 (-),score=-5.36 TRINITY_DN689_c0_g2_i1:574-1386(-)